MARDMRREERVEGEIWSKTCMEEKKKTLQ
jgi:hypothetical protein